MKKILFGTLTLGLSLMMVGCGKKKVEKIKYTTEDTIKKLEELRKDKGFYTEYEVEHVYDGGSNRKYNYKFGADSKAFYSTGTNSVTITDISDKTKCIDYLQYGDEWETDVYNYDDDYSYEDAIESAYYAVCGRCMTAFEQIDDREYENFKLTLTSGKYLDRDVDKYNVTFTIPGMSGMVSSDYKSTFYIDTKTGICLFAEMERIVNTSDGEKYNASHEVYRCLKLEFEYSVTIPNIEISK